MAEQDIGAAEDAMFYADLLLDQMKEKQDEKRTSSNCKSKFQWIERDCEGRPLLKRKSRSGETHMRSSSTDSKKIRQLRRRKLGDEKRKLFDTIKEYNEQVPEEERINEEMVESRLSVVGHASEDSLIWPWEVHSNESTNILTKKKIFDAYILKIRLQEEKILILREMRQHCIYLRGLADSIRKRIAEMSEGNHGSLTDEGQCGLWCLLRERLADVEEKFQVVSSRYSFALGPLVPEDWLNEVPDESKELEYESSEDSDLEDSDS